MDHVTTRDSNLQRKVPKGGGKRWYKRWGLLLIVGLVIVAGSLTTFKITGAAPPPIEPPEAAKILKAQESLQDFALLIPGYLPKGFDRANVIIDINQSGSGGQPAADLTYRNRNGEAIFIKQWVPVNPGLETLSGSRIIETRWGKSWLLTQGTDGLICAWVDIGPLRVSLSSIQPIVSREQLVESANTLGLASDQQAFSYITELPAIKDMAPPPPFEVQTNVDGVQELNLTITPGGFSPIRFAVKQGLPLKINFRALGDVGCGNQVLIPTQPDSYSTLLVDKTHLSATVTFTPQQAGNLQFQCSSGHFRGIMTVRPAN